MKKLFLIPILFFLLSCEEEGKFTKDGSFTNTISETATIKYSGNFVPTSGISVTGGVKIYLENNQHKLKLDNFSISSGPDLKVYLSKSNTPSDFVNLGNLTSETVYAIPQQVNLSEYKYALIHCQQYNHLFAVAELIQN